MAYGARSSHGASKYRISSSQSKCGSTTALICTHASEIAAPRSSRTNAAIMTTALTRSNIRRIVPRLRSSGSESGILF